MVLAEQKMIPRVFAAVVRAVTAVRSLVAYECGAVGPGKDCGYENPILKAITGIPDGDGGQDLRLRALQPDGQPRRGVLRHLVERVGAERQTPRRHGTDVLHGATRLRLPPDEPGPLGRRGLRAQMLQRWFVDSDIALDPQAFIISPYRLGRDRARHRGVRLALPCRPRRGAHRDPADAARPTATGRLRIADNEVGWLDMMTDTLDDLPEDEGEFIAEQLAMADADKFLPAEYGL